MSADIARPRRGRLFVIVGAVLAVLAFAAATFIAISPSLSSGSSGNRVVVARVDIPARTIISASDLVLSGYSPAPPQSFSDTKLVAGKGARVDIPAGFPVTANLIAASSDLLSSSDVAFLPIPSGFVAVTVPTSEEVGVGGYIQVGDRITMLATVNTGVFGQNPGAPVVRTVFRDVDVLRVGPAGGQSNAASLASSLTLLMTSCDAEFLFWLLNNATLKYELESFKDYSSVPQQPDPSCPSISSASGVGPVQVNKRWLFTAS